VDALAADAVALGHLYHREAVTQRLQDGVEALFHQCEFQEHAPDRLDPGGAKQRKGGRWCQRSTGTMETTAGIKTLSIYRTST
jgi:hypothetical protein